MSYQNIIRAWKDAEYRESLTEEQRSQLPENPIGIVELTVPDLQEVSGGLMADTDAGCCTGDYACPFSIDQSGCAGSDKC
ncbi:MAG: mersacidin/lichenicidin family type 2 lantibiotic [Cyanobacteria bacterium J06635_15]